jgi:hypothetical protein
MKLIEALNLREKEYRIPIGSLKSALIARARKKHGNIAPCGGCTSLDECFSIDENELLLWYNDLTIDSTHLERVPLALPCRSGEGLRQMRQRLPAGRPSMAGNSGTPNPVRHSR